MADEFLTLQAVAEALGVHYMTAYRYVRLGQLPATKDGSVWRVASSDLDAFRRGTRGNVAVAVDGADAAEGSGPAVSRGRRQADWSERYESRLTAGDRGGAWSVLEAALVAGNDTEMVYLEVIVPAMRRIGERWANGEIDVAVEHRASVIARADQSRLSPRFARRGRDRGTIILATPPGEQHSLAVSMVADLLRGAGFDAMDLGADLPAGSLAAAVVNAGRLLAVGVSVTTPGRDDVVAEVVRTIREVRDIPVLLGGQGVRSAEHAAALGAQLFAADGREAVQRIEELLAAR